MSTPPDARTVPSHGLMAPEARQRPRYAKLALLIILIVATLLHFVGALEFIDRKLMDVRADLIQRAPTNGLVIVEIDPCSLRELATWPWPRPYHARVLDNLFEAGARTVAVNIDFSSRSTDAADQALAEAFGRHFGHVILPAYKQSDAANVRNRRETFPDALFRGKVLLGAVNVSRSPDSLIRQLPSADMFGTTLMASLASVLSNTPDSDEELYLDYGIRVYDVPRLSYVDVLKGNFDTKIVLGKQILIGATAIELGNQFATPKYRMLSGTLLQSLAYETLVQHRALHRMGPFLGFVIAALGLLLLAAIDASWNWRKRVLALAVGWATLAGLTLAVGAVMPISIDVGVPVFALLAYSGYGCARQFEHQARLLLHQRVSDTRRRVVMQSVLEDSFDGILVADVHGVIQMANKAAGRLLGQPPASMVGTPVHAFFPVPPPSGLTEAGASTTAESITPPAEPIEIRPMCLGQEGPILELMLSRSLVPVSIGKQKHAEVFLTYTFRNISERRRIEGALKASEQRLRQSEAHFAAAQRVGAVGSFVRDLRTDALTGTPQFYAIFGIEPEAAGDWVSFWRQAVSPEERSRVEADLAEVARTGQRPPSLEFAFCRGDGEQRIALRDADVVVNEQGEPVALLGVVRDVTDERLLEEQLRQAQKMEALGNLTGGLAHDFNNILGVIVGNLDLVLAGKDISRAINTALAAAMRGAELTCSLLAFSRRQPLNPQRVELNEVVGEGVRLLQRVLGEDIQILLHEGSGLWPVIVDVAQLQSCLVNLANNARDAMPKGGRLSIVTANQYLDEDYTTLQTQVTPGDYVMIEVSDTGAGMEPDILDHIFEPFFTTKEPGKGTGLGLSMVFGFIEQSGGHVTVSSVPRAGTTFRLHLPRAVEAGLLELAPPPEHRPALAPMRKETVLVVEDDADLRQVVYDQLVDLGYCPIEADGPEAALSIMAREKIAVLFTDLVMPGPMDGFALAREVLDRWPNTKVLLTSGFLGTSLSDHFDLSSTMIRLINKPYRREELARVLGEVITVS